MKNINKIKLLIIFLAFNSCSKDDSNDLSDVSTDLSNVTVEINTLELNHLLDTNLIDLEASLINEEGNTINYSEIKWFSDIDGNLENSRFQGKYFLSANEHTLSCEIKLNTTIVTQSIQINVADDPRGDWSLGVIYNGAGSDFYTPDALVLETPNFKIFSNTIDPLKRLYISEYAEQSLAELKSLFNVNSFDFNGKIYIGHDKDDGRGFISTQPHFSMFIGMPENGFTPLNGGWNFNIEGIKHELMHLVELSYLLPSPTEFTSHRWFWEGIAVLVSNGPRYRTIDQLITWQNTNGGNPISIQNQPNGTSSSDGDYYPMFGLSVAYLVDSNGLGKSYNDIIEMYEAIKLGATFESAFFSQFGITVQEYETNYFTIMENYLE
ncbi:MAG: hypothetical protein JKY02_07275 [Flavobacteriaceae bacterium]|nr:hypothetical protein [Flavobacteriaceae bacterium]